MKGKKMKGYKEEDFILETFYKLPIALFENPKYKDLSNDAKILYSLILDRITLSVKNKKSWIDGNGNIYCYFTNKTAQELLNRSERVIIKLKKELHEAELLLEQRQGLTKPNRIYIFKPQNCRKGKHRADNKKVLNFTNGQTNQTNINQTEVEISASAVGGDNIIFSKGNKDSSASPPTTNKLGEFNNLILENFGKQPSPLQIDEMCYLVEEHDLEVLKLAVKECVDNGKPYFAYLNTILNNWKHQGLVTAELVKNRVRPRSRTGAVTMLDDGFDPKLGI